ncbi:hypothetical protein, partial [Candidatus Albibeggiatoa sp. nov. NOAA]|uniref:hypothetical protein n=1 Tax=Candidatus Albibeggiatoa sp. nov. NOAA TaxID=3162724 RepID=UPI0032F300E8|nr:hypothetical protein [Thiotrichaceae bacterium]
ACACAADGAAISLLSADRRGARPAILAREGNCENKIQQNCSLQNTFRMLVLIMMVESVNLVDISNYIP